MSKRNNDPIRVTVFTPTYNRAYILPQLYASLLKQTVYDFEWLIVDDGSFDNTEELVAQWSVCCSQFSIRYHKQKNGGKHRAINWGTQNAGGELFFIVDSDDQLTEDAIQTIIEVRNTLPSDGQFAGIAGNKGYSSEKIVGTTFTGSTLDCTTVERGKFGISGDRAEVFFTDLMKRYPFPEYAGETFVTEAVVWDKMAIDGYCLRYFNKIIYLCDYLEDGLTGQGLDLYYRNPMGYGHYLRQTRSVNKFGRRLQTYYDVECYLHWHKEMGLLSVAKLIGTEPVQLILFVRLYQIRRIASRCKWFLIDCLKGRKKT